MIMQRTISIEINLNEYPAEVSFEVFDGAITDINFVHILVNDDYQDVSYLANDLGEGIIEDLEELLKNE